jgi:DNA polymerase III subunit epsilon
MMNGYAIIDVETTGFSPAHHHRVIEIAIVLADEAGAVTNEWETLLDPQRDVGASEIHGLTGADLYGAPTFDMVAGEVVSLLTGRVPVAHNLAFDALFLAAEFDRVGVSVPLDPTVGLCTMRLAGLYLPDGPRNLAACCDGIGCPVESAHAALADARATARLLAHYIAADGHFAGSWRQAISNAERGVWPLLPTTCARLVTREQSAATHCDHFLARLAARTPRSEIHPEANSYLALIDRALLDRHISRHEEDELVSLAELLGLSREEATGLHATYLNALGRLALADGVVTQNERSDLERVAGLLGLPSRAVDAALASEAEESVVCSAGGFCLKTGDAVVFTGEAPGCERSDLEMQARTLGLRVTGAVSGKTQLVVAADPDSLSGKARKARDVGVPIVGYPAYFQLLGSLGSGRVT